MILVPAIIVFTLVFLSFSKEVLVEKKEPKKNLKAEGAETSMSDILLRYKLMNELGEKS